MPQSRLVPALLAVIAIGVVTIAVKLVLPGGSLCGPTYGELRAIGAIANSAEKSEAYADIFNKLQLVRIHGGHVDVDVD